MLLRSTTNLPVHQDKPNNKASALHSCPLPCDSRVRCTLGLRMRMDGLWLRCCVVLLSVQHPMLYFTCVLTLGRWVEGVREREQTLILTARWRCLYPAHCNY